MITPPTINGILRIFINMRYIWIALCLMAIQASAQKNENSPIAVDYKAACVLTLPKAKLHANTPADAGKFLLGYISNLNGSKVGLELTNSTQSPGGMHYSYIQTYAGVPVYQSQIKVNITRSNIVNSVLDNSFDTKQWQVDVSDAKDNSVIALLPQTEVAVLAEVLLNGHYEELSYKGSVIYRRDVNSYLQDSLVSGKVFYPDPLTTANQVYGGIYIDNNDQNAPWLDEQQQIVSFKASYDNGVFNLENQYLKLVDLEEPTVAPVTSATPVFMYNRSQPGFEDVNVFYHLSRYRNYVNSLGFSMANQQVYADPHGSFGDDQSYFSPGNGQPRLVYGTGYVDDAEDADVIVHEYGHFLSANAAPGSNSGQQRLALDEAFGDYLAASYSLTLGGTFNSGDVFNWDGHNVYWAGRNVRTGKKYPTDVVNSIYRTSEIWSAALMGIHDEIGGPATDSLIFEAHYAYAANMLLPDAGTLLIEADAALTGGKYYCPIYKHLVIHGLANFNANNPCGFTGINDNAEVLPIAFTQQHNAFTLSNYGNEELSFEVLNIAGQQVVSNTAVNQPIYKYENDWLPSGMYLVAVHYGNNTKVYKWVK